MNRRRSWVAWCPETGRRTGTGKAEGKNWQKGNEMGGWEFRWRFPLPLQQLSFLCSIMGFWVRVHLKKKISSAKTAV